MNSDPLLVGVDTVFPNQNSSTAPTVWEEDTDQAAQQGIPCGSGPMLRLIKRSSDQQFLPGGAVNPCQETAPFCLRVDNIRQNPAGSQRLSASLIAAGLVGGQFIGGIPGAAGLGVVGVGAPGDGVRGIAGGASGHGVAGLTGSANHAGVLGETSVGGVGVQGRSSNQAMRGDGGTFGVVGGGTATGVHGTGTGANGFGVVGRGTATGMHGTGTGASGLGVVGRGTATGVDGRGVGGGTFGVVGVGGVAGVWGGNSTSGGIGVLGVSGPKSGGITPWAGRFDGGVQVNGTLFVNGPLFVTGAPKSSVVPHPDGSERVMHTVEAPESWFEDVGRAPLRQGVARVEVDPDFAAVSGLGDDYHVFLTPEGPSNGLYVTDRSSTGFEVREQGEGTSEISFSYRIMSKRADVGAGRLERIERPSEAGESAAAEPAARPTVPSPVSPDEPEAAPSAKLLPEGAFPEPPTDWPETVPWPPEVMAESDAR